MKGAATARALAEPDTTPRSSRLSTYGTVSRGTRPTFSRVPGARRSRNKRRPRPSSALWPRRALRPRFPRAPVARRRATRGRRSAVHSASAPDVPKITPILRQGDWSDKAPARPRSGAATLGLAPFDVALSYFEADVSAGRWMRIGESPRTAMCVRPVSRRSWNTIARRVESCSMCKDCCVTPTVRKSLHKEIGAVLGRGMCSRRPAFPSGCSTSHVTRGGTCGSMSTVRTRRVFVCFFPLRPLLVRSACRAIVMVW
jgi:hypothetical protein